MSFLSRPLFLGIALCIVGFSTAQQEFPLKNCSLHRNYTNNSTYQTNLNISFFSLVSNTNGFYNFSYGQDPDIVYSIALCRGDVNLQDCRNCVNDSTYRILQDCPYQKEAIGWYDYCMIRYANRPIFSEMEAEPMLDLYNQNNVDSPTEFNQALRNLVDGLKNEAAAGSPIRKYATGNNSGPDSMTIYGLTQCTPDLTQWQCNECLDEAIQRISGCCYGQKGGRIVTPSCNLRYEIYPFYNALAPLPSPPPPLLSPPPLSPPSTLSPPPLHSHPKDKKSNTTLIVIIVMASSLAVIVVLNIYVFFFRRSKQPRQNLENVDSIRNADSLQFDFATIKAATDDFSDMNKLGQGGFGAVYQGTFYNGQEIAVKRLSMESGQGDLEFKNEVLLVAKLQHRNLVRLLGFCLEEKERLLVYEFVPNTSLDQFLFDPNKRQQLDWERRYKIIRGIARGLLYLHEDSRLRIIHRDLKPSNVLLDAEMNPKISDFGVARLCTLDQTQDSTNRIVGSYGYMAPEYALHGSFSIKSDVFSFGVLVLEIVCGRRNNYFRQGQKVDDLLSHAWRQWREGLWSSLIDPIIRHGSTNEIMRCIHIGLLCVQENVADRPTMASVVLMLNSYSLTLPVPSEPAFFVDLGNSKLNTSISQGQSLRETDSIHAENEASPLSINEASITEHYPR